MRFTKNPNHQFRAELENAELALRTSAEDLASATGWVPTEKGIAYMRDHHPHPVDLLARSNASDAEVRDAQEHYRLGIDMESELDDSVEPEVFREAATG